MERALRAVYEGREVGGHCRSRSDHGGLACTLFALRRRGLLDRGHELTPEGRRLCRELFGGPT